MVSRICKKIDTSRNRNTRGIHVRNDCVYEVAKEFCVTFKNDIPVIKTPAAGMSDAQGEL